MVIGNRERDLYSTKVFTCIKERIFSSKQKKKKLLRISIPKGRVAFVADHKSQFTINRAKERSGDFYKHVSNKF